MHFSRGRAEENMEKLCTLEVLKSVFLPKRCMLVVRNKRGMWDKLRYMEGIFNPDRERPPVCYIPSLYVCMYIWWYVCFHVCIENILDRQVDRYVCVCAGVVCVCSCENIYVCLYSCAMMCVCSCVNMCVCVCRVACARERCKEPHLNIFFN